MKREELKELGLSDENVTKVLDMHHAEIDPVNEELKKVKDDLEVAQYKVKKTEESLKKFEGIDPEKLQGEVEALKGEIQKKDEEHAKELADRDFNDLISSSIREANGLNEKAITALLDVDTLKQSKNQKEDVAAAIKALTEKDDSKMLFGVPDEKPVGTENLIGRVKTAAGVMDDTAMRVAMGLPVKTEQK